MKRFLIVGVDPGTTVAFAAIDLNGRIIRVESGKEMSKEGVVERVRQAGIPIVIACDVVPAPEFAAKIAAAFNCKLFTPNKSLSEEEKRALAGGVVANGHESDALASAVNAFHFLENKFRKVDRVMQELNLGERGDEAKQLVASGVKLGDVIKLFELESEVEAEEKKEKKYGEGARQASVALRRRFEEMRYLVVANAELRKQVERLENEKKLLEEKLSRAERGVFERVARDRRIRVLENEVARLKLALQEFFSARKKRGELGLKSLREKKELDLEKIVQEHRDSG